MSSARSQPRVRGTCRTERRTAVLVLLVGAAASLLLAGCGVSDRGEGSVAFPPVEQTTSPKTAWLADGAMLFDQHHAGFESIWRMRLGSVTDLKQSGAPYAFEQIVPKA